MALKRGLFIAVEGCDRAGKSTQTERLLEHFKFGLNLPVELMKFPNRQSASGKLIDAYLRGEAPLTNTEIHLLFSKNRHETAPEMRQKLASGVSIICDRYAYSGVAYTAAKRDPNLTLFRCKGPDSGLPKPDLVLFLDANPEILAKRADFGDELYENVEFQKNVYLQYMKLAEEGENWAFLEAANRDVEEIQDEIRSQVEKEIRDLGDRPLGVLWKDAKWDETET